MGAQLPRQTTQQSQPLAVIRTTAGAMELMELESATCSSRTLTTALVTLTEGWEVMGWAGLMLWSAAITTRVTLLSRRALTSRQRLRSTSRSRTEGPLACLLGGSEATICTRREPGAGQVVNLLVTPTGLRESRTTATDWKTASPLTAQRTTSGWT